MNKWPICYVYKEESHGYITKSPAYSLKEAYEITERYSESVIQIGMKFFHKIHWWRIHRDEGDKNIDRFRDSTLDRLVYESSCIKVDTHEYITRYLNESPFFVEERLFYDW